VSLQPQSLCPVPADTARVAHAAFPKGTRCLRIADALGGAPYDDAAFADLFPVRGQPAEAPARLALATVLQFVEGHTDREAANAVRGRLDWKYALALELTDSRPCAPSTDWSGSARRCARLILESQRAHGVRLVGPVADDPSWQARAGAGFAQADFTVDWERRVATCPAGKPSVVSLLVPAWSWPNVL